MGHSILAPSNAGTWGSPNGCTGSVFMTQVFPDVDGPEAIEGREVHDLVARALILLQSDPRNLEGFKCSDEQYEAAAMVCEDVMNTRDSQENGFFAVESKTAAPRIHAESYGTIDSYLLTWSGSKNRELWIWDFKYGYGIVEVFENWQLINYAAAIFDEHGIDGFDDQNLTVHFRIIQPRAFHQAGPIREWTISGSDLRAYFNVLKTNAEKAVSDDATTHSGPHCRYCSARHACRTALDSGMQLYELAHKSTPQELTPEALGVQFGIVKRAREQLEYLETGLEQEMVGRIRAGVRVPGFHMETGRGRERWARPVSEVRALGDLMGVSLGKDEVVTPFQARKLDIDNSIIDDYVETPTKGVKLVRDDMSSARMVFSIKGT